jgi:nucleotide-binding universal stress UspA family protein
MKNVLVPVDFSAATAKVIEHAARLAAGFASKVWLVHVAAPDPGRAHPTPPLAIGTSTASLSLANRCYCS